MQLQHNTHATRESNSCSRTHHTPHGQAHPTGHPHSIAHQSLHSLFTLYSLSRSRTRSRDNRHSIDCARRKSSHDRQSIDSTNRRHCYSTISERTASRGTASRRTASPGRGREQAERVLAVDQRDQRVEAQPLLDGTSFPRGGGRSARNLLLLLNPPRPPGLRACRGLG